MNPFSHLAEVIVLDTETTGLDPRRDRIVSIGLIRANLSHFPMGEMGNATIRAVWMEEIFNPKMSIPAAASRIHGITNEAVIGKPTFEEKAFEIRDFISDLPIIAHNIDFDGAFLDAEFKRAKDIVWPLDENQRICTMKEAHRRASIVAGYDVKWPRLSESGRYAGMSISQPKVHNALADAKLALQLAWGFKNTDISSEGRVVRA